MHLFDRTTVDDEVWDELEELLIGADVGVSTTGKLIEAVRERADKEKEGEELDELKFTFASMDDAIYIQFLRWYKEQYRKWTRGDLEYMTSGDE